jgi:SAM-dependent methyltransferase
MIVVKAVQNHFDDYAKRGDWQSLYEAGSANYNVAFDLRYLKFADFLEKIQPQTVLDAGCGSGDFLRAIPNSVRIYRGVDFSRAMILSARKRFNAAKGDTDSSVGVSFEQADILTYTPDMTFDFIIASGLTEYFEEIEPVLEKLYALTKPGGVVAVQTPNRIFFRWKGQKKIFSAEKGFAHHRLSSNELDTLAADAGFEKIDGVFVNHHIIPFSSKFPWLHRAFDRTFAIQMPASISQTRASMYIGLYQRLSS